MHTQITKKVIETIPVPDSRELLLRDTELRGFGVRISPTGTKTFFAEGNFKRSRQTKRLALGRYPVISVDIARSKAREVLYQWYVGIDPRLDARRQQEADRRKEAHEKPRVITLSEIVDRYFSNRSLKSEEQYRKVLRQIFGDWMDRSLQEITRQDVDDRYCQVAVTRGHRAQANKAMRYLSSILNFALATDINGTPILLRNPVKVLSDKKYDRSTKAKKTFLELHQLKPWITAVKSLCSPLARDLLLLQVQTGLRDSEAKGLLWEDVDLNVATFTVKETKNGSDFKVPMSTQVHKMFESRRLEAPSHSIYVFPKKGGAGPVVDIRKQKAKVVRAAGIQFSHHDLRRTFASILAREFKVDVPTIAILLNHTPTGVTSKHYLHTQPSDYSEIYQELSNLLVDQHRPSERNRILAN